MATLPDFRFGIGPSRGATPPPVPPELAAQGYRFYRFDQFGSPVFTNGRDYIGGAIGGARPPQAPPISGAGVGPGMSAPDIPAPGTTSGYYPDIIGDTNLVPEAPPGQEIRPRYPAYPTAPAPLGPAYPYPANPPVGPQTPGPTFGPAPTPTGPPAPVSPFIPSMSPQTVYPTWTNPPPNEGMIPTPVFNPPPNEFMAPQPNDWYRQPDYYNPPPNEFMAPTPVDIYQPGPNDVFNPAPNDYAPFPTQDVYRPPDATNPPPGEIQYPTPITDVTNPAPNEDMFPTPVDLANPAPNEDMFPTPVDQYLPGTDEGPTGQTPTAPGSPQGPTAPTGTPPEGGNEPADFNDLGFNFDNLFGPNTVSNIGGVDEFGGSFFGGTLNLNPDIWSGSNPYGQGQVGSSSVPAPGASIGGNFGGGGGMIPNTWQYAIGSVPWLRKKPMTQDTWAAATSFANYQGNPFQNVKGYPSGRNPYGNTYAQYLARWNALQPVIRAVAAARAAQGHSQPSEGHVAGGGAQAHGTAPTKSQ